MPRKTMLGSVGRALWFHRHGWALAAVLAGGGLATAWLVYDQANRHEHERAVAAFAGDLSLVASGVERELVSIGEELNEAAAFVALRPALAHDEFRHHARTDVLNHAALLAAEWVPRVAAAERETHERQQRATVAADYRIRALRDGRLGDSPARDDYYPVAYVEPLEPNRPALGLDLASEPMRGAVLVEAARAGRMVLTPPLKRVQGPAAEGAFLAIKAVYARRKEPGERLALLSSASRDEVRGFVVFVVRGEALLGALAFGSPAQPDRQPAFRLLDAGAGGATIAASPAWQPAAAGESTWTREVVATGARWMVEARPSAAFIAAHTTREPTILGVLSFLLFQAVGGLLLSVTARRHDRARKQQDAITRAVVDQLTEGVVVADTKGNLVLFNTRAERTLGLGLMQVSPADWSAVYGCYRSEALQPYPPERLPLARGLRGETSHDEEVFIRNPNVSEGRWISISGAPITGERGEAMGAVVAFRDVTRRRRMEAELRRLSSAVEQTADAVFITDRQGVIEYVNRGFEAATGYAASEVLGRTPRMLKSGRHDGRYYERLWKTILAGDVWRSTTVNRRKDGQEYHAEQTITALKQPDGQITHFVSVVKDVTERIRRQEREVEMTYAARVQQRLYPQAPPAQSGRLDIAGAVLPAAITGGDYFDYLSMPDGALGLAIGDVCGHGLASAFIMTETRAYLRPLAMKEANPGHVLSRLNPLLYEDLQGERNYVTLCLVSLDPASGRLIHASAGHPPAIVLAADGSEKRRLGATGYPIGLFERSAYETGDTLTLAPGDVLLLLTDGVTEAEAPTGEVFGVDRALDVVRARRGQSAAEIVRSLQDAVGRFVGEGAERKDDLTIVVCRAR